MGPLSTTKKSYFFCETAFHDKAEQKPTQNKCPIFATLHDPAQPYVTSPTYVTSTLDQKTDDKRRYIPHNDHPLRPNPTNPKRP